MFYGSIIFEASLILKFNYGLYNIKELKIKEMFIMEAQQLLNYENWVVVGDVLNRAKYAHRILNSLKDAGFNVAGVNPRDTSGNAYKSLSEVPYNIEVIDLCINSINGMTILKEALDLGIKRILIQPGAESDEILGFCQSNHIIAIEGCALIELSYYKRKI